MPSASLHTELDVLITEFISTLGRVADAYDFVSQNHRMKLGPSEYIDTAVHLASVMKALQTTPGRLVLVLRKWEIKLPLYSEMWTLPDFADHFKDISPDFVDVLQKNVIFLKDLQTRILELAEKVYPQACLADRIRPR